MLALRSRKGFVEQAVTCALRALGMDHEDALRLARNGAAASTSEAELEPAERGTSLHVRGESLNEADGEKK